MARTTVIMVNHISCTGCTMKFEFVKLEYMICRIAGVFGDLFLWSTIRFLGGVGQTQEPFPHIPIYKYTHTKAIFQLDYIF